MFGFSSILKWIEKRLAREDCSCNAQIEIGIFYLNTV